MSLRYKSTELYFNDPAHSNVHFTFGNGRNRVVLYGHRTVLYHECPLLYALLEDGIINKIKVTDFDIESFREFLRYLYLEKCKNVTKHFERLISIGRKYEHHKFEEYIIGIASRRITVEKAAILLEASLRRCSTKVTDHIMEQIQQKYSAVIKSKSFLDIDKETVSRILSSDHVDVKFSGEQLVFEAMMRYVEHNANDVNTDGCSKLRDQFGELFKLVRFPTMSNYVFQGTFDSQPWTLMLLDERAAIEREIWVGVPQHNFSSKPRVLYDTKNDQELVIASQFNVGDQRPDILTTFYTNQSIILRKVSVARPVSGQVEVQLSLIDQYGNRLSDGTTSGICKFDDIKSKFDIDFSTIMELKPLRKYSIKIEYLRFPKDPQF